MTEPVPAQRIETKVIAAGAGAGLGGALGKFLLWLLGTQLWDVPTDAAHDVQATAAVPSSVATLIIVLLAVTGAAVSGYLAPHTPRPVSGELSAVIGEFTPVSPALAYATGSGGTVTQAPYMGGGQPPTGADDIPDGKYDPAAPAVEIPPL